MDISRRQQVRATTLDIGARIRAGRGLRGLSLQELAAPLGVSWQQLQKYETGVGRVAACTLGALADELKLGVSFFFPGAEAAPSRVEMDDAYAEIAAAQRAINNAIAELSATRERLRVIGERIGAPADAARGDRLPPFEIGSAAP